MKIEKRTKIKTTYLLTFVLQSGTMKLRGDFMGLFDIFKQTNRIVLGTIKDSIVYSFDSANKQIIKTENNNSIVINEAMFFMELDSYFTFEKREYVLDAAAKSIGEKYLQLNNKECTSYSGATLIFECFDGKFQIVSQFGHLILRWYGGYNDENRQKEAVVIVEQLEQDFKKWNIEKYEQVIRYELSRKGIRENEFDDFLKAIPLPKVLQDMSFIIDFKKGGKTLPDGCILEEFCLYKRKDDVINLCWSVGFNYSFGGHTPGAGGYEIIPAEYFVNKDLFAFASYLSNKYNDYITYDDICYNGEIQILFELLTLEEKT